MAAGVTNRHTSLDCTSQMLRFLQTERKTSPQVKRRRRFIAILALLWSGMEPAICLRPACSTHTSCSGSLCLDQLCPAASGRDDNQVWEQPSRVLPTPQLCLPLLLMLEAAKATSHSCPLGNSGYLGHGTAPPASPTHTHMLPTPFLTNTNTDTTSDSRSSSYTDYACQHLIHKFSSISVSTWAHVFSGTYLSPL